MVQGRVHFLISEFLYLACLIGLIKSQKIETHKLLFYLTVDATMTKSDM